MYRKISFGLSQFPDISSRIFFKQAGKVLRDETVSDLNTAVAVSLLMMSLTVGQFKLCIKPIEGVSKLLFVTILGARFATFKGLQLGHPTALPYRATEPKMWLQNCPIRFIQCVSQGAC